MLHAALLAIAMTPTTSPDFRGWGLEALQRVQTDLLMPDGLLYGEEAQAGRRPTTEAFNWGVGVMLQALNAAARLDVAYQAPLSHYVEAARRYWNDGPPVAGYDVHPMPKPTDRYYDDNAWMALALVEASDILGSEKDMEYAEEAYRYVLSGEDSKLGGGIYWRESDRPSKNTCSNAPAAAAALALYGKTGQSSYLADAERIYDWTREHLRDPKDGLYWDGISLDGTIEPTKWTYNSGLMLRDAVELLRATGRKGYADDAREIQAASLKRWVVDGRLADEGKFFHLLLENWLLAYRSVPGTEDPRSAIRTGLAYLHNVSRDSHGHYGDRWDRPAPPGGYQVYKLIDQAAAARAYLISWRELR